MNIEEVKKTIRDIPDFPVEGIIFKDITPVLAQPDLFKSVIAFFAQRHQDKRIDKVACIDARGFIFGGALACALDAGLVPIRKKGKLPYKTIEVSYDLEYGSATLCIHEDALAHGENVLLIDDLLATGGTAAASVKMIEKLGAVIVEVDFLVELAFLNGREKLAGYPVFAPIVY